MDGKPVSMHSPREAIDLGRRDGAPALHAHPGDDGRREHRARRRAAPTGRSSTCAAAEKRVRRARRSASGSPSTRRRASRTISVGQQQRAEILKALYRGADILILDEPTAVLTPQEARELFAIIESLKAEGKSIVFITHKLNEVLEIADRITVLRRGKTVGTVPEGGRDRGAARALMVGREVLLRVEKPPADARRAAARRSRTCTSSTTATSRPCRGVSFTVRRRGDRRARGRGRKRPERARRRDRRPAQARRRAGS